MTKLTMLRHNKIDLALHQLSDGDGLPLLLLHGLGERTVQVRPPWTSWAGPIYGLDFTGHGKSSLPRGGGYSAEVLMSDVDAALAEIGPATVVGRGLGAYVGLLVAGARPGLVMGVVVADGPGLVGGGPGPGSSSWFQPGVRDVDGPDPFALHEMAHDIRPPDYATGFVHLLMANSALDSPVMVTAKNRPPWLEAVAREPGVVVTTAAGAMTLLSR